VPSRKVLDRTITACAIKASVIEVDSVACCQGVCGFLKQIRGASISLRVQVLFMAIVAGRAVTGARGSGSVGGRSGLDSLRT
jgi:hypothetical protein